MRQPCLVTGTSEDRAYFVRKGLQEENSMRLSMLAELALDLVTRHPLSAAGLAVAAAAFSWLVTRTRGPV